MVINKFKIGNKKTLKNLDNSISDLIGIINNYRLLIIGVILGIVGGAFSGVVSDFVKVLTESGHTYAYPTYVVIVVIVLGWLIYQIIDDLKLNINKVNTIINFKKLLKKFNKL